MGGLLGIDVLYDYAVRALAVLIVIPFHEAAHALVSWWLGDPTAKNAGRLSLIPLRHFDPLGTLCMVLGGVGWAKPVGIDPRRFRNPKIGMAVSAAAGRFPTFCWDLFLPLYIRWCGTPVPGRPRTWSWTFCGI